MTELSSEVAALPERNSNQLLRWFYNGVQMHPDFKIALLAAGIVSFCCFIFAALGLFAPEILGWQAETALITKGVLAFLLISPRFLFYPAWQFHRQILRAYHEGSSASMLLSLEIEENDDDSVTACLRKPDEKSSSMKVRVRSPKAVAFPTGEIEARVFYGEGSGEPLLIEAENFKLWSSSPAF